MKKTLIAFPRPTRLALAIAAACAPLAVLAQPLQQVPLYGNADMTPYSTNNVEIGGAYSNDDSFKFGEWTGLRKKGGYFLGSLNFDQLSSATGNYLSASGWNLGLPSRQLDGAVGQQGRWGLNANYNQLTRYVSDTVRTPFVNPGGSVQDLPPGFVPITSSNFNAANYGAAARYADVTSERKVYGVGGSFFALPGVELIADFNQTARQGSLITGTGLRGTGALNPIDEKTDQFNLGVRYSGEQIQAELTWWYSKFKNDVSAPGLLGPGFKYQEYNSTGTPYYAVSLAPDNEFNQVSGTLAYAFAPAYRMVGTVSHSWGSQNSPYLVPFTNASAGTSGGGGLTITSYNGKTSQTLVDLTFTGRPLPDLGIRANYRYDDRQNDSPQNRYGATNTGTSAERYNLVPNYKDNRFLIEADYRLMRLTKLRGWYEYKKQEYDPATQFLRTDTTNNQFGAEISSRLNPLLGGSLKYVWDKRSGGEYTADGLTNAGRVPATSTPSGTPPDARVDASNGQPVQFNDVPNLRQYWVANYSQDTVKGTINLTPSEMVALQLVADWKKRDYNGPSCGTSAYDLAVAGGSANIAPVCVGLNKSDRSSFTIDGQFAPMDGVALFAFYSWSDLKQDQTGTTARVIATAATLWGTDYKSKDSTIGLGASYKPASLPLSGGIQYLWTKGNESWNQVGVGGAAATNFPDNDYKQQSVQLWAGWRFNKDVTLKANYWWQKMSSLDWANTGVQPWSLGSSPWLSGQQSPNYTVNVFAVSANVRF